MNFREKVIGALIENDELFVSTWAGELSEIFLREYGATTSVECYLLPTCATVFKPDRHYFNAGVVVNDTRVDTSEYVIPYHLMFYLRYELAKNYSLVFKKVPRSTFLTTDTRRREVKCTILDIDLK